MKCPPKILHTARYYVLSHRAYPRLNLTYDKRKSWTMDGIADMSCHQWKNLTTCTMSPSNRQSEPSNSKFKFWSLFLICHSSSLLVSSEFCLYCSRKNYFLTQTLLISYAVYSCIVINLFLKINKDHYSCICLLFSHYVCMNFLRIHCDFYESFVSFFTFMMFGQVI